MKIYFGILFKELDRYEINRALISYYDLRNRSKEIESIKQTLKDSDIFLDSGAFSAYTQNDKIDLVKYISFLKQVEAPIYASLDVIYDASTTRRNFEEMLKQDLNPIPTFHYGSDKKELDYYSEYPYIALGGLVPHRTQQDKLIKWLDYCFAHLIDKIKDGKLRVHAFGVTNPNILTRYPFYSTDSTSWLNGGRYGEIYKWKDWKMKQGQNLEDKYLTGQRDYLQANTKNMREFEKMERAITNLWKERGIIYDD